MFVFCLLYEVELSSLQDHLLLLIHLQVSSHPVSLPPLLLSHHVCITCLIVCAIHEFMFPPTAPLVSVLPVVVGVVATGVIIVTVVVVIVCLLIVVKHKHRKNSLGKDSLWGAAATAFCSLVLIISTAPIEHVYWTQTTYTMESKFVLSHMHVQINLSALCTSQFYRCDEKKDLKVKYTLLEHFVLSEFLFSV